MSTPSRSAGSASIAPGFSFARLNPGLLGLAWSLVLVSGCVRTVTTERRLLNPELDQLEGRMKLLPAAGEDGVSPDRSTFETMKYASRSYGGTRQIETKTYANDAYTDTGHSSAGNQKYEADSASSSAQGPALEQPRFGDRRVNEGDKKFPFGKDKAYNTGGLPEGGQRVATSSDPIVDERRRVFPEPRILRSPDGVMTVDDVRALLERGNPSGEDALAAPAPGTTSP